MNNKSLKKRLTLVRAFVLYPVLFPSRGDRMRALSSECKIDQTDTTNWIDHLTPWWKLALIQKHSTAWKPSLLMRNSSKDK